MQGFPHVAAGVPCTDCPRQRRLEIIEDMRHDHGTVLPPETTAKLSAKEVDYFKQYDTLLTEFMTGLDLDITAVGFP